MRLYKMLLLPSQKEFHTFFLVRLSSSNEIENVDVDHCGVTPLKYVSVAHLYSITQPYSLSYTLSDDGGDNGGDNGVVESDEVASRIKSPPLIHVYSRRKRKEKENEKEEVSNVGVDLSSFDNHPKGSDCEGVKKWFKLEFDGVDQMAFVGLKCQVYWPLDDEWYEATIAGYDAESHRHNVEYDDGDKEELVLSQEQIKFYVSNEEMDKLSLRGNICIDDGHFDYSQLTTLAAMMDQSGDLVPGKIIWAKVTGHAIWPAIIVDELLVSDWEELNKSSGGTSHPVQFFGTYDFARVQVKQIVSFAKGLESGLHLKCKSPEFLQSLKEAKMYLKEQKLPDSMLNMQSYCEDSQRIDP